MAVCLLPQNQMLPAFKEKQNKKIYYETQKTKSLCYVYMYKHGSLIQKKNHAYPENNILPDIYSLTCLIIWFGLPNSAL